MKGFKIYGTKFKITLLGQNVDSYLWYGGGLKKDFTTAQEINNFCRL
jgi:tRNA-2-methylthio-N6-dimethylallyladenosine synthase